MNSRQNSTRFWDAPALFLLRAYKKYLSWIFWGSCRYKPTCSEYTYQAVLEYGTIAGLWLGFKRILTCHP